MIIFAINHICSFAAIFLALSGSTPPSSLAAEGIVGLDSATIYYSTILAC